MCISKLINMDKQHPPKIFFIFEEDLLIPSVKVARCQSERKKS